MVNTPPIAFFLLKMMELFCALPSLFLLATLTFNEKLRVFEMDHGDVSLTMTIFAFATSTGIFTVSVINGTKGITQTQLYRMNYAIGSLSLAVNTIAYAVRVWDKMGPSSAYNAPLYLCIANSVIHLVDYLLTLAVPKAPGAKSQATS